MSEPMPTAALISIAVICAGCFAWAIGGAIWRTFRSDPNAPWDERDEAIDLEETEREIERQ